MEKKEIFDSLMEVDPELSEILGAFAASYAMWSVSDDYQTKLDNLSRCIGYLEVVKMRVSNEILDLVEDETVSHHKFHEN